MRLKFIATFCFLVTKIYCQTWVTIPDSYLVTYFQNKIPAAMNGNQLDITSSYVLNEDSFNMFSQNILNLSGIQYFTSLKYLNCQNNQISIIPALPSTLEYFNCSYNGSFLTSLPNLPSSLKYLDCRTNHLYSLPALPNTLKYLDCGGQNLGSLPALPLQLAHLRCDNAGISTIPALPPFLTYLHCGMNGLNTLPPLPNTLSELNCGYTNINNLNLPQNLTYLYWAGCNLSNLPSLPSSLTYLNVDWNNLTNLVIPNNLQLLSCKGNDIFCFPTFPSSIETIYITSNPFDCLPNHIPALDLDGYDQTFPICTTGNINNCPVAIATSINENKISQENILYPNPNSGHFIIKYLEGVELIKIVDVLGKTVYENDMSSGAVKEVSLNIETKGIYYVSITTSEKRIKMNKVIIN